MIIIFLFLFILSFRFAYQEQETLTFSGSNIYRSIYVYEIMKEQGYQVNLDIKGKWVDTQEPFDESVLILSGARGQYEVLYNDHIYTVGGPSSAVEDISANYLKLVPMHKSVVKVGINPITANSLDDLSSNIEDFSYNVVSEENVFNIGIHGDILIDVNASLQPTLVQEIDNILKPNNEITLFEKGIRLSLENSDTNDLHELSRLLKLNNFQVTRVATSDLDIQIRSTKEITENQQDLLKSTDNTDFNVFLLNIFNEPLQ